MFSFSVQALFCIIAACILARRFSASVLPAPGSASFRAGFVSVFMQLFFPLTGSFLVPFFLSAFPDRSAILWLVPAFCAVQCMLFTAFGFACAAGFPGTAAAIPAIFLCSCIFIPVFAAGAALCACAFFDTRFFGCPLAVCLFFSACAGISPGKTARQRRTEIFFRLCVFVVSVSLVLLSARFFSARDCTAGKAYTLSPAAKAVLTDGGTEPYSLIYSVSPDLLSAVLFPGRTAQFFLTGYQMRAMAAVSGGRISPEIRLVPRSVRSGIPPVVLRSLSSSHIFPFCPPPEDFEYSVVRIIEHGVLPVQLAVFGTASGTVQNPGGENSFSLLPEILWMAGYEVRQTDPDRPDEDGEWNWDPEIPLLFVFPGAGGTAPEQEEALTRSLRRFLENGGSAAFFVSAAVPDAGFVLRNTVRNGGSPFFSLLAEYGTGISPDVFFNSESCYALPLVSPEDGSRTTVQYPFWVQFLPAADGYGHPLFSGISRLCLFWPNRLSVFSPSRLQQTDRICLSGAAVSREALPFDASPFAAARNLAGLAENGGLSAQADSFPVFYIADDGMPGGRRLIVSGDAFCLSDLQEIPDGGRNGNARLAVNCADWLWRRDNILGLLARKREGAVRGGSGGD